MSELKEKKLDEIEKLISGLADIEAVKVSVVKALDSGAKPTDVVNAMSSGLEVVGNRYEKGEYFLSELIMAGIISNEVSDMLKPYLEASASKPFGKVVIGTVKGDVHDVGKNIVAMMLSSTGFQVVDLGVDVPLEMFLEKIREGRPEMVAMSCLLTISMDETRNIIEEIRRAGLRDGVKIMVGGRPITKEFAEEIGADAYASNAAEAVRIARSLLESHRGAKTIEE